MSFSLDAVVVEFVVGSEGGQCASADAVSEENLRGAVDPRLRVQ